MPKIKEKISGTFSHAFRALQHRNYQLFFAGQGISLIGTWMQRIAMSWLVYQLTGSLLLLGAVTFINQLPTFLLAPIAGVYADRWDRRRTLVITQILSMIQSLILAFLVLGGWIQVWHIILLGASLGIINAFDMPTRQTFVKDMVDKPDDLSSAIALNSSLVNGARILGPSVAGVLIGWVGEGLCFLLNGLSYLPVIWALKAMKLPRFIPQETKHHVWEDLVEGSRYVYSNKEIRGILLLLSLVSLLGASYQVLMPAVASDLLQGGPELLGLLMGVVGFGAIAGAFVISGFGTFPRLVKWIPSAAILLGVSLVLFGKATQMTFSILALLGLGIGQMIQMTASNSLLQSITSDEMRGRVMSFYTMAFMGMAPFGGLLAGSLADAFGLSEALIIGGIVCVIGGIIFRLTVNISPHPRIEDVNLEKEIEKL